MFPSWFRDVAVEEGTRVDEPAGDREDCATSTQMRGAPARSAVDVKSSGAHSRAADQDETRTAPVEEPIVISSRSTSPSLPALPEIDTRLFDDILSGLDPEVRSLVLRRAKHVAKTRSIQVKSESTYVDSTTSETGRTGRATSDAQRLRTADKGKFRAVSRQRRERKHGAFWIASSDEETPDSRSAALVESDRRYALSLYEREEAHEISTSRDADFAAQLATNESQIQADSNLASQLAADNLKREQVERDAAMARRLATDAYIAERMATTVEEEKVPVPEPSGSQARDPYDPPKSPTKPKKKRPKREPSSDFEDQIPLSRMAEMIKEETYLSPVKKRHTTTAPPPPSYQTSPNTYLGNRMSSGGRQRSQSPSKQKASRMRGGHIRGTTMIYVGLCRHLRHLRVTST
jgi:hypothetical protein